MQSSTFPSEGEGLRIVLHLSTELSRADDHRNQDGNRHCLPDAHRDGPPDDPGHRDANLPDEGRS
jgi:hypothetical protein